MGKLSQLLRWKTEYQFKTVTNEDGSPLKVWIRIIGDKDLEDAFKASRIASSKKRQILRDKTSDDYYSEIAPLDLADAEQCKEIIRAAKSSNLAAEAFSAVVRPDPVELSEVAIDPDAPTLEEQEKLDNDNEKQMKEYQDALAKFVETKVREIDTMLDSMEIDALREMAKEDMTILVPTSVFIEELAAQKTWRAVYMDEGCKVPAFDSADDFKQAASAIKDELVTAYKLVEIGPDELKNS
jgi:hypothetical protein